MNNIEILENKIQCFRYLQSTLDDDEKELFEDGIQQEEIEAIENLIKENKELKKENLELHKEINQRIKLKLENERCADKDFIPKSKVKEKIKELNKEYEMYVGREYSGMNDLILKTKTLENLLEE